MPVEVGDRLPPVSPWVGVSPVEAEHDAVAAEDAGLGSGGAGKSHPVVECSDYTWFHLPFGIMMPRPFKAEEAIFAILAARIAFSSLFSRSLLR